MAERAAHLVDHVLPDVPVRQWVLTIPHRLRYLLAWRHDLCRAVVRILHRAIERHFRTWARLRGAAWRFSSASAEPVCRRDCSNPWATR